MTISPNQPRLILHGSKPGRRALAAMLLAAFAVAIVAGSALAANLLLNGSFEIDGNGDGVPDSWTGQNLTPQDKRNCKISKAGDCSFKMLGDGANKSLYQIFEPDGPANTTFTLSMWTKGKDLVGDAYFYIFVNHADNNSSELSTIFYIPAGTSPWTWHEVVVVTDEPYNQVIVFLASDATGGKVWFDKAKLLAVD